MQQHEWNEKTMNKKNKKKPDSEECMLCYSININLRKSQNNQWWKSQNSGFAMATVGDISQDKLTDVAIGAPLEGSGADDGSSFGSVYIYNGHWDGLSTSPSQVTTGLSPASILGLWSQMLWPEPQVSSIPKCQTIPGGWECPMKGRRHSGWWEDLSHTDPSSGGGRLWQDPSTSLTCIFPLAFLTCLRSSFLFFCPFSGSCSPPNPPCQPPNLHLLWALLPTSSSSLS